MAKPTSFRHPVHSRSDDRIAALIGDRGALGYGLYWMIIEAIHREELMRVDYCDKQIRRMAATMGAEIHGFRTLLSELIDLYDLLAIEDGWLVSAIAYRKPKQRRALTAVAGDEQDHTSLLPYPMAAAEPDVAAQTVPIPEGMDDTPAMLSNGPLQPASSGQNNSHDTSGRSPYSLSAAVASTDEVPTPAVAPPKRGQYSVQELQYYEQLKEYIQVKAPRVSQMQEPFSLDQAIEIG